jgi:CRP/FNR family transcriptional regulator, anaerobic regulatory protein
LGINVERDASLPNPARDAPAGSQGESTIVSLRDARTQCVSCSVRTLCIASGMDPATLRKLDELISARVRLRRKEILYRPREPFSALYAIRFGTLKTTLPTSDGREQVMGYCLAGDIIGFDGIGDDRHTLEATALEDSEVCVLPFDELDRLGATLPSVRRSLFRLASRELGRGQAMMMLLGSRSAEERLVMFLLDVAERYRVRGYSYSEFVLRMTRDETASYLGLKLETVSRLFSSLQESGLIQVQGRAVKLLDPANMRKLVARAPN